MARKKREHDEAYFGVKFEDADPQAGEVPLSQLDEFIISGRDDKGGQVTITVNVPPSMDRQLDVILHSKRFPYANKRDIVRHAMMRHFIWIFGIRQSVPRHILSMLEADLEVCRDDEISMKIEQVFLTLQDRVAEHIGRGEDLEVVRLVSMIQQKLKELKPSAWVRRYAERFYNKYGGYLKARKTEEPPS